ncbi:MAG: M48 family metallopeptidase [Candidatus Azobacteroides sp.]|nr:M48 family metallopeptidase [Candidatus Azobacteroides sp.]
MIEHVDKELGKIIFRRHETARRFVLRIREDAIYITLPKRATLQEGLSVLEKFRDKLSAHQKENGNKLLDENTNLSTYSFSVHIFRNERKNFYFSLKNNILHISCPQEIDFYQPENQQILKKGIERFLRLEAKRLLPERIRMLAEKHGFIYNEVKINRSKGRWGSCTSKKTINLSLYLMLLPEHLLDYVLLHELTHTIEMNHSARFWEKLNAVTNGKALTLRAELKKYKTQI